MELNKLDKGICKTSVQTTQDLRQNGIMSML